MRRLSPIYKEGNQAIAGRKAIHLQLGMAGRSPGEQHAIGPGAGAAYDFARVVAILPCPGSRGLDIVGAGCPCLQARFLQSVQAKSEGLLHLRLIRVGRNDFHVRAGTQREQGVVSSAAWVLSANCGPNAQKLFQLVNGVIKVLGTVNDMVDYRFWECGLLIHGSILSEVGASEIKCFCLPKRSGVADYVNHSLLFGAPFRGTLSFPDILA